jgi:hydrogenase nickel incorporation protein HypA/HybF
VHELSIASSLVEIVTEAAREARARRVTVVHLRLGALAGVAVDSLGFCYDIAVQDTLLEGSRLNVRELPVVIYCLPCDRNLEMPGVQRFRCPVCGTASADVRQGNELEIESIEIEDWPE